MSVSQINHDGRRSFSHRSFLVPKQTLSWSVGLSSEKKKGKKHLFTDESLGVDLFRGKSRDLFNPYFGSVFRTHTVPTYFHRRLARFADIYTSNVCNFQNYPVSSLERRQSLLWLFCHWIFSLTISSFHDEWLWHMRMFFPHRIWIYCWWNQSDMLCVSTPKTRELIPRWHIFRLGPFFYEFYPGFEYKWRLFFYNNDFVDSWNTFCPHSHPHSA